MERSGLRPSDHAALLANFRLPGIRSNHGDHRVHGPDRRQQYIGAMAMVGVPAGPPSVLEPSLADVDSISLTPPPAWDLCAAARDGRSGCRYARDPPHQARRPDRPTPPDPLCGSRCLVLVPHRSRSGPTTGVRSGTWRSPTVKASSTLDSTNPEVIAHLSSRLRCPRRRSTTGAHPSSSRSDAGGGT